MCPSKGLDDPGEGDVGVLWRRTLEYRLSHFLTNDGLNRKESLATAQYAMSRGIAKLEAVTSFFEGTNGTALQAWADCPRSADAFLHLRDRQLARYLH